ncbi:extracellular solute-binding protein [Celeribacter indicus]|uniref:Polyamine ABC transporter substrate-binding protein n=1 Tax=Celeribacter indicus TaxID=1208324 RepID=A0A0B5DUZ4_9RHOB|nr:extracellular solute-binding protein [Celeribacter indicus]AJE47218.1 polyamine ABC transporter substrate-binding protein [Celeribacter indicus]SDW00880.1 spermidine/putrescine transport system substrate-binding protein [Celeribacter indicus]
MTPLKTLLGTAAFGALASAATAEDPDLLVFDYSGFENPAFHTKYEEKNGQQPSFAFFGEEDEALQKLVSGFKADVSHVCAGSVMKWEESGILEPWDTSKITEYSKLDSNLLGNDVAAESTYFIPTDFGSTAIAYNTEDVPEEAVATLQVFKDPEYAGRMTLPDNVDDAYALAYLATGTTDWTAATDEQFQAASDWLREVHPNLRTYWTDPAELAQLLATGEVLVAWAWNETLPTMAEEGFPIGFQREAEEGSSLWLCGYVNLRNGPGSEEKAYDFLNSFLDASNAETLMSEGYGISNTDGLQSLGEQALIEGGLEPIDVPVLAQLPMPVELREKQSEEFEKIKAGF